MANEKFPAYCYYYDKVITPGGPVKIVRGKMGYYETTLSPDEANVLNDSIGITKEQIEAMVDGSMFGWDKPYADPDVQKETINQQG